MVKQSLNTIGARLAENARRFPAQDALVFPGVCRLSWSQLNREVDRVASGMLVSGVQPGTHIALWSSNRPEWVLTFLAAARIGAVIISIDPALQAPEFKQQLAHSDAAFLFMASGVNQNEYLDIVNELIPQRSGLTPHTVTSTTFPRLTSVVLFGAEHPKMTSFDQFIARGDDLSSDQLGNIADRVTADALVNIQYTSAAFGTPKGVLLRQSAILQNGAITGNNLGFSHTDRLCLPLPFFHAFGCSLGLMLSLAHAATLVVLERFSPESALKAVADERCTALHGVPTMFLAQLESEQFTHYDLSTLRTGIMAGAPCPVEVMQDVIAKMHAREITIAYGQTEAGPLITQTTPDGPAQQRVATVGRPLQGVEVKLVDPVSGLLAVDGCEGELCARSSMLMDGYYKMPEETALALDAEGWLHTGDLAIRDAAGCFRITGRLRNMIIRGGQNIYPAEVETCLLHCPQVSQVQVFAVPDRKLGELVAAKVVLAEGQHLDTEALRDFCKGKIAHYKIPSTVEFVTSL